MNKSERELSKQTSFSFYKDQKLAYDSVAKQIGWKYADLVRYALDSFDLDQMLEKNRPLDKNYSKYITEPPK